MITLHQTIVVTHDDSMSGFYKKELTEEEGWKIEEDNIATSYSRTLSCHMKGKKDEHDIDRKIKESTR